MIYLWVSLGIVGGVALIWAFVYFNNGVIGVTRYTQELGLEREVKIVHLSDLHGKAFGYKNARLIKKVAAEKPDFIVFTGDIIHKYRENDKRVAVELVSALCGIAPVIYASGNHEMRGVKYRFLRKELMDAGATVLDDCSAEICGVTVTGLNCASLKNGTAKRIAPPEARKTILLAHMPHLMKNYADAGYGLVLSGHAHGGQWRIPFTGKGLYAPGQGTFPKLTQGRHISGKTTMIISRGLGNSEFPLRLFNRPEVVALTVK